ncbi:MAG: arylamine N-acetyltransferase [Gorillibacterium sp.]|nr:arylamine N-acetyltransferase [Gorillibacterium sp.]
MVFTPSQLQDYLTRLKITAPIHTDSTTLTLLQAAHLKHIPYENYDILHGIALSLEPEDLFAKIITRHRGGYCFELNGLYSELLKTIGFQVTNYASRYFIGYEDIQKRRHRVLKAEAEGQAYLCDVGVRIESPRKALRLTVDEIQTDGISQYRFTKEEAWGWMLWQKEAGKDWVRLYAFTEEPQLDIDYIMASFYCEKHPDSPFHQKTRLSIFDDNGHIALDSTVLKFYEGANIVRTAQLEDSVALNKVAKTSFGIDEQWGFYR